MIEKNMFEGIFPRVLFSTGIFEMKMKYDESDNALIRASRAVTDRVTGFLGDALLCVILIFKHVFTVFYNNSFP